MSLGAAVRQQPRGYQARCIALRVRHSGLGGAAAAPALPAAIVSE